MKINLSALLQFRQKGAEDVAKKTDKIEENLKGANRQADKLDKKMGKTASNAYARGSDSEGLNKKEHRAARGTIGSRGAAGRNFSGIAGGSDTGGFVAAYATIAANIFAITAAFQALSKAAQFEQLEKGLKLIGAQSGTTLSITANGLKEVTGFAVSSAEAMRTVAQATAAGFGGKEIERIGAIAKGASVALGRDMSDSMDRLTRGVIKLEPELLDEIGIMTRLDEAVKVYALEHDKAASSLTQTEKRQAFMNAVLAEGEKKFGSISKSIEVSPYDKLSASVRELGTNMLTLLNGALGPLVQLMADFPVLALLPLMGIMKVAASKILPDLGKAYAKTGDKMKGFSAQIEENEKLLTVHRDKISSSQDSALNIASKYNIGSIDDILNPQKGIARSQAEINRLKSQGYAITSNEIMAHKKLIAELNFVKEDQNAINRLKEKTERINEKIARQERSKSMLGDFADDKLATNTFTAIGRAGRTTMSSIGTGFRNMGSAAITFGKILGSVLSKALGIITLAVSIGTLLWGIFKSITTNDASRQFAKLKEDLKAITENAKETNKQVKEAFDNKNYSAAFEGAISSLQEISNKLKEISEFKVDPLSTILSESILSNSLVDAGKRFGADFTESFKETISKAFDKDASFAERLQGALASAPGSLAIRAGESLKDRKEAEGLAFKVPKGQEEPIIEALRLLGQMHGSAYAEAVKDSFTKENYVDVLQAEMKALEGIKKSWSSIGEEADKASKALDKFYGKNPFENEYSDVANAFTTMSAEAIKVNEAFDSGNLNARAGIFDEMAKGGIELFKEMDALTGRTDNYYRTYYNTVTELGAKLRIAERDDRKNSTKDTKATIAAIEQEILQAKSRASDMLIATNFDALASLKSYKMGALSAAAELAKGYAKVAEATKSIAANLGKAADLRKTASDFRAYGTDSLAPGISDSRAIDAAKRNLDLETGLVRTKFAVIDAEWNLLEAKSNFELEKLRREQVSLKTISGGAGVDSVLDAFNPSMPNSTSQTLFGFNTVDVQVINQQQAAIDALTKAMEANRSLSKLQKQDIASSLSVLRAELELSKAKVLAFNEYPNIIARAREAASKDITLRKQLLDLDRANIASQRELSNIRTTTARLGTADNPEVERLQQLKKLQDEQMLVQRDSLLAAETYNNDRAAIEEKFAGVQKQYTDEIKARRDAGEAYIADSIQAMLDDAKKNKDAEINSLTQIYNSNVEALTLIQSIIGANIDYSSISSGTRAAKELAKEVGNAQLNLSTVMNTLGMSRGAAGYVQEKVAAAGGLASAGGNVTGEELAIIKEQAKALEYATIQAEGFNNIMQTVQSSIEDAFMSLVEGSKSAAQAFGDMAVAILKSIAQMIVKMLVFKAIEAAGNAIVPGAGTVFTSFMGGRADGGIMAMANGGIADRGLSGVVKEPTYLVGEGRQNEAVVPLPNGRSIPVQMTGGSSGDNNVSVNINMTSSGDQKSSSPDPTKLGQAVAAAVQRELVAQKAPGGLLSKYGA